jgi:hypothetical protein
MVRLERESEWLNALNSLRTFVHLIAVGASRNGEFFFFFFLIISQIPLLFSQTPSYARVAHRPEIKREGREHMRGRSKPKLRPERIEEPEEVRSIKIAQAGGECNPPHSCI